MSKVNPESYKQSTSELEVSLHPTVIVNISDHYTRAVITKKPTNNIYGLIIGTQKGRAVELRNSLEIMTKKTKSSTDIDVEFFNGRWSQFKEVFKTYEILGWYRVGNNVEKEDFKFHQQISQLSKNDNPIFLLCGTKFGVEQKNLPIHLFESVVSGIDDDGKEQYLWCYTQFKIETEISEGITLDHVSKNISAGENTSSTVGVFNKLSNAVLMLQTRLKVIVKYLNLVSKGKLPFDVELVRKCAYLSTRLPAVDSNKFKNAYDDESISVLMITYMSTMTKCTNVFNEVIDKFNLMNERSRGGGGGGRGRFQRDMF